MPDALAPALFAYDQDNHCYVSRQPATVEELESALDVIVGQEYVVVRQHMKVQATSVTESSGEASLSVWWVNGQLHALIVRQLTTDEPKWLLRHTDHIGLSLLVDEWLKHDSRFINVQWFTENDWYGAKHCGNAHGKWSTAVAGDR